MDLVLLEDYLPRGCGICGEIGASVRGGVDVAGNFGGDVGEFHLVILVDNHLEVGVTGIFYRFEAGIEGIFATIPQNDDFCTGNTLACFVADVDAHRL